MFLNIINYNLTMERGKKTSFILRQFRKKSKRTVNKDLFTEFFYLNRDRRVIEFLKEGDSDDFVIQNFFKKFLAKELRPFVEVNLLNDVEEPIKNWYYEDENLVLLLKINWGFKKQEISLDVCIENFIVTVLDDNESILRKVDYVMLNDHLISFLTLQARNLSEVYENISNQKKEKQKTLF
jgi:hypothetical protein